MLAFTALVKILRHALMMRAVTAIQLLKILSS